MKRLSIRFFLMAIMGFFSSALMGAEVIAVWTNFVGLASDSPIAPQWVYSVPAVNEAVTVGGAVSDVIDGSQWKLHIGDGASVNQGVISTGSGSASYITFGDDVKINVGYIKNPLTVLVMLEAPVTPVVGAPFVNFAKDGRTGIGLASGESSGGVRGAWGDAAWSTTTEKLIPSLASLEKRDVFIAVSSRNPLSYAEVTSDMTSFGWQNIAPGLKSDREPDCSRITFGNYYDGTSGGLDFKIKGVVVFSGDDFTPADMKFAVELLSGVQFSQIDADMTIDANSEALGAVFIPSGVTVTVSDASKITSDTKVAGSGTIIYNGFVPSSKSGLNTCFWTGTAKIVNFQGSSIQGAAEFDVDGLGSASSVIELENDKGWIANETVFQNLKLSGDGFAFNNGSSTSRATITVENLIGSGSFAGSQGNVWRYGLQVKNMDSFAGSIDMSSNNSREIAFLNGSDTAKFAVGKIVIAKTAKIAAGKVWKAINGVQILSTGTLSGTGEVDSQLVFEASATLDVTDGFLNVKGDVILPQSGSIIVKIAEDETVDVNEPGTVIACSNANALDLSKITLSPEPNFRYVLKARGGKVVYERASGFSVIVR